MSDSGISAKGRTAEMSIGGMSANSVNPNSWGPAEYFDHTTSASRYRGTTSKAAGLIGASDPEQLDYARREGRVLVTHDDDFLRIHAAGAKHVGIAYAHQKRLTIGQTVLALGALHRDESEESVAGHVKFLAPAPSLSESAVAISGA